jgi:hypothetical protein
MTVIFAGLTPYFAFSVIYDPDQDSLGLKPREPPSGTPSP